MFLVRDKSGLSNVKNITLWMLKQWNDIKEQKKRTVLCGLVFFIYNNKNNNETIKK